VATNTYETRVHWTGSTGVGWEHYDRTHVATASPAEQEVRITTGESKGDPAVLNPEQLVVMAASSCQMLMFLHLAAKARIDVVEYDDAAEGVMPDDVRPMRITEIVLRPRITVRGSVTEERVRHLCEVAHRECYIANSVTTEITVEPAITIIP
jgi:organic hydroperoxide reductase OsmC/OhrA